MASTTTVMPAPRVAEPSPTAPRSGTHRAVLVATGVAAVAFLVRLIPVLHGGGLDFYGRYDDAVYYTASEALSFGRVPYRDFVMLHPPGLMLALLPFVGLGRLTTDPIGLAVGRVCFMLVGALNTAFIVLLARRWGWVAAVTGGLLYACWMPAVYGEQATMLEPLATTLTLGGLLLLCRPGQRQLSRRAEVLAGVLLGLAVTFKIWYVAPFVAVVVFQLWRGGWRSAARTAVGGVVAAGVVLLPFFILAPGQMFRMLVLDQVGRAGQTSLALRLAFIFGVRQLIGKHWIAVGVGTELALLLVALAVLVCVRDRVARLIVVVFGVNVVVLFLAPDFYPHYPELTAAPLALVVGIGLGKLARPQHRPMLARGLLAALGIATLASAGRILATPTGYPFPQAEFDAAAPPGCVTADDPQAMIDMNRLTSDFRQGCTVPVDVSGITYDRLSRPGAAESAFNGREVNPAWQRYLHDYLFSGSSFVIVRPGVDLMTPHYVRLVNRAPVLAEDGRLSLREGDGPGSFATPE